jgi:hypothetical protein
MRQVLGAAGVLAALMLVAVYGAQKIPPIDVPWHLATGRRIVEEGIVPVTNTFSWTFPDHPLPQQYPLYQAFAWLLLDRFGWPALSLANQVLWLAATLVWLRWAGTFRALAMQPLLVLLVCLGVQRHLLVRPEVVTLFGLGVILLLFDRYRAGSRAAPYGPAGGPAGFRPRFALGGVVAVQWVMAQCHQLWVLGIAVQVLFLAHLVASRSTRPSWIRFEMEDRDVPIGPAVAALVGSIAVLAISPLGIGVYAAPLAPLLTLWTQGAGADGGAQAEELALVWSDPLATFVVLAGGAVAFATLVRSRGRWSVLELGVLAIGAALVVVAVRGIPFYAVAVGGLVSRTRERTGPWMPPHAAIHPVAGAATIVLALASIVPGITAEPRYTSTQLGYGRSVGDWGDGLIASLEHARPGEILNLGWVAGNPLVFGRLPVFVDPRFEAYPKPFLARAIAAARDPATLRALVAEYDPDTIVAEMRLPEVQDRVAELVREGWTLTHVDALFVVLRPADAKRQPMDPATVSPGTDSPEGSVLRAQEHLRLARLLLLLDRPDAALSHVAAARTRSDDAAVAWDLAQLPASSRP